MDKNKSHKLAGFIAKLTLAANKAVKKDENHLKAQKSSARADFQMPLNANHFDYRLHQAARMTT